MGAQRKWKLISNQGRTNKLAQQSSDLGSTARFSVCLLLNKGTNNAASSASSSITKLTCVLRSSAIALACKKQRGLEIFQMT